MYLIVCDRCIPKSISVNKSILTSVGNYEKNGSELFCKMINYFSKGLSSKCIC